MYPSPTSLYIPVYLTYLFNIPIYLTKFINHNYDP